MNQWISVYRKLPPRSALILIAWRPHKKSRMVVEQAKFVGCEESGPVFHNGEEWIDECISWMPMPKPPKRATVERKK